MTKLEEELFSRKFNSLVTPEERKFNFNIFYGVLHAITIIVLFTLITMVNRDKAALVRVLNAQEKMMLANQIAIQQGPRIVQYEMRERRKIAPKYDLRKLSPFYSKAQTNSNHHHSAIAKTSR